jgi:hypothetical protein
MSSFSIARVVGVALAAVAFSMPTINTLRAAPAIPTHLIASDQPDRLHFAPAIENAAYFCNADQKNECRWRVHEQCVNKRTRQEVEKCVAAVEQTCLSSGCKR